MYLRNKVYKVLKNSIDQRGPINYDNAMSVAVEVARACEKEVDERTKSPKGQVEGE